MRHFVVVCGYKDCQKVISQTRSTHNHTLDSIRPIRYSTCTMCKLTKGAFNE